jgi:D-glycero-D-manno-heptose 1,7-bisphosphate phosphatase
LLSAVFLDRDGVINENREDYIKSVEELKILPGAVEALARLSKAGFRTVIISNQQGVGRGLITPESLDQINRKLLSEMAKGGASISGIYYCPHLKEEDCSCRKPKPGMLFKAADELGIDTKNSVFIGDTQGDIEAGRSAGCTTLLTLSGKTTPEQLPHLNPQPDLVVSDLSEAVTWIMRSFKPIS